MNNTALALAIVSTISFLSGCLQSTQAYSQLKKDAVTPEKEKRFKIKIIICTILTIIFGFASYFSLTPSQNDSEPKPSSTLTPTTVATKTPTPFPTISKKVP